MKEEKNESRPHNRRLAQWRVKWLIEHSTSPQLLWCIYSFVLRNPPLRQAANRYLQCKKDIQTGQFHILMDRQLTLWRNGEAENRSEQATLKVAPDTNLVCVYDEEFRNDFVDCLGNYLRYRHRINLSGINPWLM